MPAAPPSEAAKALVKCLYRNEWDTVPLDHCSDDSVVECFGSFVPLRNNPEDGTVYFIATHDDETLSLVSYLHDGRMGAITKDQNLIRGLLTRVKEAADGP